MKYKVLELVSNAAWDLLWLGKNLQVRGAEAFVRDSHQLGSFLSSSAGRWPALYESVYWQFAWKPELLWLLGD